MEKYDEAQKILDEIVVGPDEVISETLETVRKMFETKENKILILDKLSGLFVSGSVAATKNITIYAQEEPYTIAPYTNSREVVFKVLVRLMAPTPEGISRSDYLVQKNRVNTQKTALVETSI